MLHVIIGIIINPSQQILINECLPGPDKTGHWEFPGGKVEPHETPYEALQRELAEELGIEVTEANAWKTFQHTYPSKKVFLDAWIVKSFNHEPQSCEGQQIRWVSYSEINNFNLLPGNRQIIEQLAELFSNKE